MYNNTDFVVNDDNMGINVEKNGRFEYVEKASFSVELTKHVDAGPQSGFLANVNCSLRGESK